MSFKSIAILLATALVAMPGAAADPIPPLPPTGVTAQPLDDGTINVTWTQPLQEVVAYTVYRNGEAVGTTPQTWFRDMNPDPISTYTVTAWSKDGEESPPGGPAVAQSQSGPGCAGIPPGISPQGCVELVFEYAEWIDGETPTNLGKVRDEVQDIVECLLNAPMIVVGAHPCFGDPIGTVQKLIEDNPADPVLRKVLNSNN